MKVILLMAMTVDGKIARSSNELVDWTGKEDKDYFVKITRDAGVMIMGSKTYDTIGKPLPYRRNIVMSRDPERKSTDPDLIFTNREPDKIIQALKEEGFKQVALIGGSRINSLFASRKLITEVHVTVAPKLFGTGLSLFDQPIDMALELIENSSIGENHILMKYKVIQ